MAWADVVGSVTITMYNSKAPQRWRIIDNRGVDLAPALRRLEIKADPYVGTLAYLTLHVHPDGGVILNGPRRGIDVEFCYSVRSIQTDHSEAEALATS